MLSYLWPGLGQLYLGNRRLAVVFSVPAVLILAIILYQLRRGVLVFAVEFVVPEFALTALVIIAAAGIWRLAAVAHAYAAGGNLRGRRIRSMALAGFLAVTIVAGHGAASYAMWVDYTTFSQVFAPNPALADLSTPKHSLAPGATLPPPPTNTPAPTPHPITSRVTIVFTSLGEEDVQQYDSIMVVSYDPKGNTITMVSVPRDSAAYPMYYSPHPAVSGKVRIAYLPRYVANGWVASPDSPYMTLVNEVSYLVGIPIDYYAVMNLGMFVQMIDIVGGIDVNNPTDINDTQYDWMDGVHYGFQLSAGRQHLDGKTALAYVRSRRSAGDSDIGRDGRQQEVLRALVHQMSRPDEVPALLNVFGMIGPNMNTSFPRDVQMLQDYVAIAQNVPDDHYQNVVLGPPYTVYLPLTDGMASSCLLNDKVAQESVQLFGQDSLWYGKPLPDDTCPS